jgi:hypothetical protein
MKLLQLIGLPVVAWALGAGCGTIDDGGSDSNTNFQVICSGAGECSGDLTCICGICTRACSTDASCTSLSEDAACISLGTESLDACGLAEGSALCTTRCSNSSECGSGLECLDRTCVAPHTGMTSDAGMATDAAPPLADSGQSSQDRCQRPEFFTCTEPYLGARCPENPEGQGPYVDCGIHVGSLYDGNGCRLPACASDAECSDGDVCVGPGGPLDTGTVYEPPCNGGNHFFCEDSGGTCSCGMGMACRSGSACLPREAVPEAFLDLNCREGHDYGACADARSDLDSAIALFDEDLESYTEAERRWLGECAAGAALTLVQRFGDPCGVDACELLCELHPCTEGTACVEQCRAFTDGEVVSMLEYAARTPGMCTCDICVDVPFTACAEIWQCQAHVP